MEVIWSEMAVYEGADRFQEIIAILKQKYGDRIVDLVPSNASGLYLYGDRIRSIDEIKEARAKLRSGLDKR